MTAVVSLYECGERRRETRRQDMLLSDTAPDAQKHDVILSPTDTFGVISSGAVSAVLLRHRTPWPTSPHRTGRPATLQSRSAPPKTRSGIVSSQLSALSTTLEQGPEIFEVSHAEAKPFPTVRQNPECRTAQWKKDHGRADIAISGDAGLCSAAPGSCGTAASKRCSGKKTSSSRSTAQHRAAAAPTGTVRCRDDGFLLDARLRR